MLAQFDKKKTINLMKFLPVLNPLISGITKVSEQSVISKHTFCRETAESSAWRVKLTWTPAPEGGLAKAAAAVTMSAATELRGA